MAPTKTTPRGGFSPGGVWRPGTSGTRSVGHGRGHERHGECRCCLCVCFAIINTSSLVTIAWFCCWKRKSGGMSHLVRWALCIREPESWILQSRPCPLYTVSQLRFQLRQFWFGSRTSSIKHNSLNSLNYISIVQSIHYFLFVSVTSHFLCIISYRIMFVFYHPKYYLRESCRAVLFLSSHILFVCVVSCCVFSFHPTFHLTSHPVCCLRWTFLILIWHFIWYCRTFAARWKGGRAPASGWCCRTSGWWCTSLDGGAGPRLFRPWILHRW